MHLLLTDRMACPRCGPEFGLILLSDRMEGRRVVNGSLGCPNCRERYPVVDGVGDLRPPPRRPGPASDGEPASEPRPDPRGAPRGLEGHEFAALLGISEGPGNVLLLGEAGRWARELAEMVDGLEWVVGRGGAPPAPRADRSPSDAVGPRSLPVSRMHLRGRLPFHSRSFRGVVVGAGSPVPADEAVRALAPLGRIVFLDPAPGTGEGLLEAGLEVLLDDPRAVVGTRKS